MSSVFAVYHAEKSYDYTSEEAKCAASAIVQGESVRLRLFVEALQGTLRFLSRLASDPTFTPPQKPIPDRSQNFVVAGLAELTHMIDLLRTFLGETVSMQGADQQGTRAGARVKHVEQRGMSYIYHIVLTDPDILPEPCEFTLIYQEGSSVDEVVLQEVERDG